MKKTSCILLAFAVAMILFAFGCASADMTDGLVYDETNNIWAAGDEDLAELVSVMKRECTKSPLIKGTYGCRPGLTPISFITAAKHTFTRRITCMPKQKNTAIFI